MKRSLLPLNAVRAFEAAGRLGRMSAAAEELGVTPGAVSRQVQALEALLGFPLFEGSRHRPVLTSSGVALLLGLSAGLEQIEASLRSVSQVAAGVLDVSCLSTFTMRWLIPRLYRFSQTHPEIVVRLTASESSAETDRLRHDVIVSVETLEEWQAQATENQEGVVVLFLERLGLEEAA
jgi:LysR family transcriptional regulator, glycine cleavage system transcriptional activator